jgi:hypothetical protein
VARTERPWIVTPHAPIEKVTDNLWAVESAVPGVPIKRRMSVIKLGDGRLVFFHAVPLDDKTLEEVTAWGKPAFLFVGHANHGIDATPFQKKLGLKLLGPRRNEGPMRKKFSLDGTFEAFDGDPSVEIESIPGAKTGEPVVTVRSGPDRRASLLFCDAFQNNPTGALVMRLAGFVGSPRIPIVFRLLFVDDKRALKACFERLAKTPNLQNLVPCHGDIIRSDAAATLARAAAVI